MLGNLIGSLVLISVSLFLFGQGSRLGVFESAIWSQPPTAIKDNQSQTITQVGDYVITVKDLEQIISVYPAGSISTRESKVRVVESLLTTKLFALAARSAKVDADEDFIKAKEKARENTLIYTYFKRYVQPKFSEEEARKYFAAHKDELQDFSYSRNRIVALLRDQALTETNESLMQQWGVKQRDDLLKDLDLRSTTDSTLILAQIGPAAVTVGNVRELASQYQTQDLSTLTAKKDLLNVLVLERLYRLAAEKAGLVNDPEVQKALAWSEDQLLAGLYIRSVEGKISLEDAQRYYKTHTEEFKQPDQIRLRQIVVATPEEAQAVKTKLDRGETFESVAKFFSTDQASAARGGDIGWVREGRLQPEIEKVAFQLQPKQVSDPIKTLDGYHIVQVEERLEGRVRPFEQVAPTVSVQLKTSAVNAERQRLMKLYKVTINKELL